jgi:lipopolysaccharide transport system ATP-binding protein
VLGIIGRNGAGKSTLLKILSKITEPTKGKVELKGRVGSLLEVGTGFHPELTGHENIYLYGAILGMDRWEVTRKFDEIVAFAELEKFIDTPVKRYSSGMYMRLAFAVAAHLEPEILLVDEVLAVGDAMFQKKCLGKMGDVSKAGRTVLFVSHNMIAVRNMCSRTIWIQGGHLFKSGDTHIVTEDYLKQTLRADCLDDVAALIENLPSDPAFRLHAIAVRQNDCLGNVVLNDQPVEIEIQYCVLQRTTGLRVYLDFLDDEGNIIIRTFHDDDAEAIPTIKSAEYISTATIPANLLAPRIYEVRVRAGIFNVRSCVGDGVGIPLTVEAGSGINRGYPQDTIRAKLQPKIPWYTVEIVSNKNV